jgi:hypothetical protein
VRRALGGLLCFLVSRQHLLFTFALGVDIQARP